MKSRAWIAFVLVGLIIAPLPMAFASPPDETWLGGLFDDGDYDDVVLLITGATQVVWTHAVYDPEPERVLIGTGAVTDDQSVDFPTLSSHHTRAPPTL